MSLNKSNQNFIKLNIEIFDFCCLLQKKNEGKLKLNKKFMKLNVQKKTAHCPNG